MILKKDKRKTLLLWYSVNKNLGDWLLFKTVKNRLENWGYDVIDTEVGGDYKQIAKLAKKCDFLWFAGGGIIERWIPDIICNFKKFHKKARKVKYGITGLSIGDFSYAEYYDELAYWVNNSEFFYTRDEYSSTMLNKISESDKVISGADVVFATNLCEFINKDNNLEDVMGVNFRTMPYPDITGKIDLKKWESVINEKYAKEHIVLIPDSINCEKDLNMNYYLEYSPNNAVKAISITDYGLAMRFHVILIAAKLGKVYIPICYCPKVARLAEQLGISDLCMNYDEPEKLCDVMDMYLSNREKYNNILNKNVELLEKKACDMFDKIREKMEA